MPAQSPGDSVMTSGPYLPPEGGFNGRRDGDYVGSNSSMGRNVNVYGNAGMVNSNTPGIAAPDMRPYGPASGGTVAGYGMPGMENPSVMPQDTWAMGYDTSRGAGSFLSPTGQRQNPPFRQEPPAIQGGGPGLGLLPSDASATLYVEGIPADCKRREAAHIFRPFIGFKEVRLVYKEAKVPGGDQFVLCFVDFADARCATTALEALQGYKLDESDPNGSLLKLQFARFSGERRGGFRDDFGGRRINSFGRGQ